MAQESFEDFFRRKLGASEIDTATKESFEDFLRRRERESLGTLPEPEQMAAPVFDPSALPLPGERIDLNLEPVVHDKPLMGLFENIQRAAERPEEHLPYFGDLIEQERISKPFRELLAGKTDAYVGFVATPGVNPLYSKPRPLTGPEKIERIKTLVNHAHDIWSVAARGKTIPARVSDVLIEMVPYAIEFGTLGTTAKPAKEFYKQTFKVLAQKYGSAPWHKALQRMLIYGSETGYRTGLMFPRIAAQAGERQLPEYLGGKGMSPGRAWLYAFKDIFIENFSEKMGPVVKSAFYTASRRLAPRVYNALRKAWNKQFPRRKNEFAKRVLTAGGFDGVIGELSEERIGEIMREFVPLIGTGEGFEGKETWDKYAEGLLIELIAFSIPGMAQVMLDSAIDYVDRKEAGDFVVRLEDVQQRIDQLESETDPDAVVQLAGEIIADVQEIQKINLEKERQRQIGEERPDIKRMIQEGEERIEERAETEAEREKQLAGEGPPPVDTEGVPLGQTPPREPREKPPWETEEKKYTILKKEWQPPEKKYTILKQQIEQLEQEENLENQERMEEEIDRELEEIEDEALAAETPPVEERVEAEAVEEEITEPVTEPEVNIPAEIEEYIAGLKYGENLKNFIRSKNPQTTGDVTAAIQAYADQGKPKTETVEEFDADAYIDNLDLPDEIKEFAREQRPQTKEETADAIKDWFAAKQRKQFMRRKEERRKEEEGDYQFSQKKLQADRIGEGTDVATVRGWASEVERKFNIPIGVNATIQDLPTPELVAAAEKKSKEGVVIQGIYHEGRVEVVASGIDTEQEFNETIIHEVIGHAGFRGAHGYRYKKFLRTFRENPAYEAAIFERIKTPEPSRENREEHANWLNTEYYNAAEEWFAERVGKQEIGPTLWNSFKKFIRDFLRLLGVPGLKISDADLASMVSRSAEAARKGKVLIEERRAFQPGLEMFDTTMMRNEWYSQMERVLEQKLPKSGTAESYRKSIEEMAQSGKFKKEELEFIDILDAEDSPLQKEGKLAKEEVMEYVRTHKIKIVSDIRPREGVKDKTGRLREISKEVTLINMRWEQLRDDYREDLLIQFSDDARRKIEQGVYDLISPHIDRSSEGHSLLSLMDITNWINDGSKASKYFPVVIRMSIRQARELEKLDSPIEDMFGPVKDMRKRMQEYHEKRDKLTEEYKEIEEATKAIPVKWPQYAPKPGGKNYREILLEIPSMDPVYSRAVHFPSAPNVVVYLRVKEFISKDGKKTFFIDELQSDIHSDVHKTRKVEVKRIARERARGGLLSKKDAKALAEKLVPKDYGYKKKLKGELPPGWSIRERYRYPQEPFFDEKRGRRGRWVLLRSDIDGNLQPREKAFELLKEKSAWKAYEMDKKDPSYLVIDEEGNIRSYERSREKAVKFAQESYEETQRYFKADFPFKTPDKYALLALKKAIRMASEEGFERIAWSKGIVHVKRWEGELRRVLDEIQVIKHGEDLYSLLGFKDDVLRIDKKNLTEMELEELLPGGTFAAEMEEYFEKNPPQSDLGFGPKKPDNYINEFRRVFEEDRITDTIPNIDAAVGFITSSGKYILSRRGNPGEVNYLPIALVDELGIEPGEISEQAEMDLAEGTFGVGYFLGNLTDQEKRERIIQGGYIEVFDDNALTFGDPQSAGTLSEAQFNTLVDYFWHLKVNRPQYDYVWLRDMEGNEEAFYLRRIQTREELRAEMLESFEAINLLEPDMYAGSTFKKKAKDITIGGKGYEDLYDNIIPQVIRKYTKKWGVEKPRMTEIVTSQVDEIIGQLTEEGTFAGPVEFIPPESIKTQEVHSIDINETMRQAALQGQPAFRTRAARELASYLPQPTNEKDYWKYFGLEWHMHIADQYSPLELAQRAIEKEKGISFEGLKDAITKVRLMKSKAYEKINNLLETIVSDENSMVDRMRNDGITLEDFGYYLWARHAEERNRVIKQRDIDEGKKDVNEYGSGMEDAFSREEVERLERLFPTIRQFGIEFDGYTKKQLQVAYDSGLLTEQTFTELASQFNHYAPIKGVDEVDEDVDRYRPAIGTGLSIPRREFKTARGRILGDPPINPFAQFLADMSATFIRAEKNAADNAFLRIVNENPSKDWEWYPQAYEEVRDSKGVVKYLQYSKPKLQLQPGEMTLKITPEFERENPDMGLKRGQIVAIKLKHPLLIQSMTNLKKGIGETKFTPFLRKVTSYFRNVHTVYNPEFILRNMFRDTATAFVNVWGEDGMKAAFEVTGNIREVIQAFRGDLRKAAKTKSYYKWIGDIKEWRQLGGPTGFVSERDVSSLIGKIDRELKAKKKTNVGEALRMVGDLIKDYNEAVEQAVRVSAFRYYKDHGFTPEQAAAKAKDLTVDFDRKGFSTSILNAAYLFLNASIQGTDKMRRMFFGASTKVKMTAIGSMLTLTSLLVAEINRFFDPDWDDYDEFTRDNNFMVTLGPDHAFSIPAPYGYSIFHTLGNILSDSIHGELSITDAIARFFGAIDMSFNPVSGGTLLQMGAPTILDIPAQLYENRNYFGGPIYKEQPQYGPHKLNIEQYFSTVTEFSKYLTRGLFWMTGGDLEQMQRKEFTVDINPEWIDFLGESVAGGLGKFIMNIFQTGAGGLGVEELNTFNKVPFLRTFVKETPVWRPESIVRDMVKDLRIKKFSKKQKDRFEHNLDRALELGEITKKEYDRYDAMYAKEQKTLSRKQIREGRIEFPEPKSMEIKPLWERF